MADVVGFVKPYKETKYASIFLSKLVDSEPFTKEEHDPECTIVNLNTDLQLHEHNMIKITALKDTFIRRCIICYHNFFEAKYLHLHLAEKHNLFDDNFQAVHLLYPFMEIATDIIRK